MQPWSSAAGDASPVARPRRAPMDPAPADRRGGRAHAEPVQPWSSAAGDASLGRGHPGAAPGPAGGWRRWAVAGRKGDNDDARWSVRGERAGRSGAGLRVHRHEYGVRGAQPAGETAPTAGPTARPAAGESAEEAATFRAVLDRYCVACHNGRTLAGSLALDDVDLGRVGPDAELWEKVLEKLHTRAMPPPGRPRPRPAVYDAFGAWLERSLDQWAADHPNPGRPAIHRLNRLEYANAVRDLLHLEIDAQDLLPADDMAFGFDNNAAIPDRRAGAVLAVHVLGAHGQPSRRRGSLDRCRRRALSGVAAADAGRADGRGPAVRLARRRRGAAPLSPQRRLRAAHRASGRGAQRAAGDRRPGGRRARRPAARGPLARRTPRRGRRAPARRTRVSRCASRPGRGPGSCRSRSRDGR